MLWPDEAMTPLPFPPCSSPSPSAAPRSTVWTSGPKGYNGRKVPRSNLRLSFPRSSGKSCWRRPATRLPACQLHQAERAEQAPRHTDRGETEPSGSSLLSSLPGSKGDHSAAQPGTRDQGQGGLSQSGHLPSLNTKRLSPVKCGGHHFLACWVALFPLALDKSHTPHHPQNTNQKTYSLHCRHHNPGQIL